MRIAALRQVGGFREDLIAGEEPELCLRLRRSDWEIWRLPQEMTSHDARIYRFSQWWRRTMRGGYAYANILDLHKSTDLWRHSAGRAVVTSSILPLALLLWVAIGPVGLLLLFLYPAEIIRVAGKKRGHLQRPWTYATFMLLAKFAETEGILRYIFAKARRKEAALIEYQSPS
jgi:hypothetical protein